MAKIIYKTKLDKIVAVTPSLRELLVKIVEPPQFKFTAGQFVMLHVPQTPKPALRAYSIASDDRNDKSFRLLFKLVPGGVASEFVKKLKGGETLEITGPFGKLTMVEPPTDQVVFVSTGAGLSQHMSFLLSKCEKYPKTEFRVLLGVWKEEEIFYQKELEDVKKLVKNFSFQYVIDSPTPMWKGLKGFVTDHLEQFNYQKKPTTFYLCGNPAMIKGVKKYLIEDKKFDEKFIYAESFG